MGMTGASGEDPCLGVVVYARGSWYYTYLDAPPAVFDQLLHRQDSQINFLEILVVLLFVTTSSAALQPLCSLTTTASWAAC